MKYLGIIIVLPVLILSLIFLLKNKKSDKIGVEMKIRSPAVAGSFYPASKKELENQIKELLDNQKANRQVFPKILIVPHAGYSYSGLVASTGFKLIENQPINRVIILGCSHQAWFSGAVIDENDAWETPLGKVQIDKELAKKLIDQEKGIRFSSPQHLEEHSLEVELPFLQIVLKEFKIVPILMGNTDDKTLEKLAELIGQNLDQNTILIISSDLSHYPNYELAQQIDQKTIDSILTGDPKKFNQIINQQMAVGHSNLDTCACADKAIKVAMMIGQKSGKGKWRLIKYANSGDIANTDQDRVVGYATIAWEETTEKRETGYTEEEKNLLLKIARESLESYLKDKRMPQYEIDNPKLEEKLGVFVTLNKKHQLRGCIGEFEPTIPLWQTIQKKVIDAALNDPRFPPVTLEELSDIEIEISVLSKPKKIDSWKEIELGKHGVIIRQGSRGGTFLPQVATETGWTLEQFLSQLCSQKAGLPSNCYKNHKTEILVYTAEIFSEEAL